MIAEVAVDHPILSLSLVNEVLEYIHIDFKNIIYREGNPLFANDDDDDDDEDGGSHRLPVSMILNSRLEDYFADVLLCDRFKKKLCDICAKKGQLESLKWARSKGCPWTQPQQYIKQGILHVTIDTCSAAAEAGHLHILQWARENGCDWNWLTCYAAAEAGHWDVVVWAVQNGVSMDREDDDDDEDDDDQFNLCEFAASKDRWDIVQLALNNGCTCSEDIQLELLVRQ